MKKIGLLVLVIGMTSLSFSQTASPELVSSAGGSFSNTSYQLDWSIGECITATQSAGDYVITQGFHQNTYIITAVEDLRAEIEMTAYPNPTSDFISLKVDASTTLSTGSFKIEGMQYSITDFSGRVLQTAELKSDLEQINFSNYSAGTYFISVLENNQLIKSFKIIKN